MNILKYVFHPSYVITRLASKNLVKMDDKKFLEIEYKRCMGKKCDFDNPRTFNEKMQWLKLNDRKDIYTTMVDKCEAKKYVAKIIGEEYIVPTICEYADVNEIDFNVLPDKFVLKCNHNSGLGMCICKDKSKLNIRKSCKLLKKGLKQDYYLTGREWPYKNVKRKILCEEYMEDNKGGDLSDYKFMCFNGRVECSFVCSDRFSKEGLSVTFFDREWNEMPFTRCYPKSSRTIEKPKNYEKMIELAESLSKDIPFVRVDFYEVNDKIYFGELTFFPGSGMEKFSPEIWDEKIGKFINIK